MKNMCIWTMVAVALVVSACSSSPPTGTGGAGGQGPSVTTWELPVVFDVAPGEEVQYVDMPFAVADDAAIVAIRSLPSEGVHHVVGWDTSLFPFAQPGPFVDPNLTINLAVPFFVSGTTAAEIHVPAGWAYPIKTGGQITVQAHLLSATSSPITATAKLQLDLADNPQDFKPVAATGMENKAISIPAGAAGHVEHMECAFPLALGSPYAVYPHAHRYAKWMRVSMRKGGDPAKEQVIHDGAWDFDDQPIYQLDPDAMSIDVGDVLVLDCTYDNPTPNTLVRGESSNEEMCAAVVLLIGGDAAPGDQLALHGCISGNAF